MYHNSFLKDKFDTQKQNLNFLTVNNPKLLGMLDLMELLEIRLSEYQ